MKLWKYASGAAVALTLIAGCAFAQENSEGQGTAVVTLLPQGNAQTADSLAQKLTVKVGGKETQVTGFRELKGERSPVELVLLVDGSARSGISREFQDIAQFVRSLPPNVRMGVAYMENGRAVFAAPFSTDRNVILRGLHMPTGLAGTNGSPYFCLSDLATHWPSQDGAARREVVMITDGVDEYSPRYDPDDPYVQASIHDAVRAHLTVYSIYWRDQGRFDRTMYADNDGQNLLQQVTETTGGKNYWIGIGNPVSFLPYFDDLEKRLRNQYELSFTVPLKGKAEIQSFKLKLNAPGTKADAPQQVYVTPPAVAQE